MTFSTHVLAPLAASALLMGCNLHAVTGNGLVLEELRSVPDFHALAIEGSMDTEMTVGHEQRVLVRTDENLQEYIELEVISGTLHVGTKDNTAILSATEKLLIIDVPTLDGIAISGSGDVKAEGVTSLDFDVAIAGSGDVDLTGVTTGLGIMISGSGDVYAADFLAEDVEINISGSGNVTVYASESISGTISGSGDVLVYGNPSQQNFSITGSGNIEYR